MTDVTMRTITQTIRIDAAPEVVYQYWVDPVRMREWWGAKAELDARPGGVCRVEMEPGPVMAGEYVELVPHERVVFTFGWEQHEPGTLLAPGSTRVEVTLQPDGDATILTLVHSDMPDSHADDHAKGWAHYLGVLAEQFPNS